MLDVLKGFLMMVIFVYPAFIFSQSKLPSYGYLDSLKTELQMRWPKNRTINLVFHGHSVPSGYLTAGVVNTVESYPFVTLKKVKKKYPYAVINTITTAIGGEQSEQGAERFKREVLPYRPDILCIDYALNDRNIGLERAKIAWEQMIREAKAFGTKIFLLTPTPDTKEDIFDTEAPLAKHSEQIRKLAETYEVGLIDSYTLFKTIAQTRDINAFMAQNNHINKKGHELVASEISKFFELDSK